jgi:ParB-like chromosome segregation protein Spo0J
MKPGEDPVDAIVWMDASSLSGNLYNPNVVHAPELRLLETSILEIGWIQPILVSRDSIIIDGYHRWRLALESKALQARYGGRVPCAVLDLDEAHAMLLTVRINRAKGTHVAVRMSELVQSVVDAGLDRDEVARQIGATRAEVDLLYQDDVFKARDIPNRKYGRAWIPIEVPGAVAEPSLPPASDGDA